MHRTKRRTGNLMNGKLKAVIIVLLLFIPTYLAVANYVSAQSPTVEDSRGITNMSIVDPDGKLFYFKSEATETGSNAELSASIANEEIKFLTSVNKNAKAQEVKPDAIATSETFTVTYESFNKKSVYEYYFSHDPDAAFLRDPDGVYYKIKNEDASAFLCKDYAACLYDGSVYPILKIGDTTVVPKELSWRYQLFNGQYRALETETSNDVETFRMNARLAFSFNLEPDLMNITVYKVNGDTEEKIFEDTYANLSQINITETTSLRFHVEAKWYEVDGKEGQGEATYEWYGKASAPASFSLNEPSIERGEFCVITVKDKPDDADILFASEPDIGFTPKFVEDGDYHRALVPIAMELEAGTYTFTVICDGVTQELSLSVTDKKFQDAPITIPQSIVNATRTEATLAAFDETMLPVAKSLSVATDHMFKGTFAEGVPAGTLIRTGFGRWRVINNGVRYQHEGVDYLASKGTNISAVNDGVVIYVGTTELGGNMIVIEHGLGLKSWYLHLSEISVALGDTVAKNDVIGISGNTGFSISEGWAHIGLSVFEIPVCPYRFWENEIVLPNP